MINIEHIEKFEQNIDKIDHSGCWLWTAGKDGNGYGVFGYKENGVYKQEKTHRLMYKLHYGVDPGCFHVLHKCDVRHCLRPEHLFLGTNADNVKDKVSKGRQAKGVNVGTAEVPFNLVQLIRKLRKETGMSFEKLARLVRAQGYDVHRSNVYRWVNGQTRVEA